jgi:phosphatidylglycerophosphatase A
MLGLGRVSLYGLIAAFVLFRCFDIVKLGPVGWADRKDGAIGVMADDVVAGLIVAAILFVITILFPNLIP